MKPAIDVAYELATKYAQGIWWARTPVLSRRDPRLKTDQSAPAVWCEACETSYAELPNNKSPYISAAEAAPAHTTLVFSQDVVDACTLRMAEHLMRHSPNQLHAIIEPTTH